MFAAEEQGSSVQSFKHSLTEFNLDSSGLNCLCHSVKLSALDTASIAYVFFNPMRGDIRLFERGANDRKHWWLC